MGVVVQGVLVFSEEALSVYEPMNNASNIFRMKEYDHELCHIKSISIFVDEISLRLFWSSCTVFLFHWPMITLKCINLFWSQKNIMF